jgi:hypothetical protein
MRLMMVPALVILAGSICLGQSTSSPPNRVEEDWQIVIATPSPNEVGPQLTTTMSPVADGSTPYVAFDLNYRDTPSFQAGGLQVKVCSNGNVLTSSSQGNAVFQTTNETITWTQRMSVYQGNIVYRIVNGQSTTWGAFGSAQGLQSVGFGTSVTSLASYSPAISVANSGAGWQFNRVTSMTLLRVRYYSAGQLISTDNNARSVTLSNSNTN